MKTVILLRHADIDASAGPAPLDWPLNAAGGARADELVHVLGDAGITSVFASEAARTQQTVAPLRDTLELDLRIAGVPSEIVPQVLAEAAGDMVLVVGHSNTVPEIIRALGAPFAELSISGHDRLFVVMLSGEETAKVVRLRYGAA